MSELRNQLDRMRDDYQSQRYPGDLAAEIFAPPTRKLPVRWIITAATTLAAVAACIALYVGVFRMPAPGVEEVAMVVTESGGGAGDFAMIPPFPSDMPLAPQSAEPVSELGAMPELPSMDLTFDFSSEGENPEDLS